MSYYGPKLTRRKTGDRAYNLVTADGTVVASAVMTGEHGRDHYPWDWSLSDHLIKQVEAGDKTIRTGGSMDSLKNVVGKVSSMIEHYGLLP